MKLTNNKFSTSPFFIHYPFEDFEFNRNWHLIKNFFNKKKCIESNEKLKNISVITWNNCEKKSIFEKSCNYFGINCDVLGKNIKNWKNEIKIDLTYDFLKSCKKKYVIGIDAFDAVMLRKLDETILDHLEDKKIIFNHTPATFPPELSQIHQLNWKFRNLNAGAWIGEINFLINFYKKLINLKKTSPPKNLQKIFKKYRGSEQLYIKIIANEHEKDVWTDANCQIFQVLHGKKFKKWNDSVYFLKHYI